MKVTANSPILRPPEVFAEGLRAICGAFQIDHDGADVAGTIGCVSKAGFDLAFVKQNSTAIRRGARQIKSDPGNHFFLVIQKEGSAWMEQDDALAELQPGDMFLVDSTRPSSFHYRGQMSHQVSLHLPRDETLQRFGRRVRGGMEISRREPLAQAMRAILKELLEGDAPQLGHVAEAFHGVFGAYLFNRSLGDAGKPNPDRQLFNRALAVMAQRFTDPDLSPSHVANLTGVSLRKLQRTFANLESSPHKRLQDVRLNAAKEAFSSKANMTPGDVSTVAFACGYRDLSTFHRQFKARFGHTPTEWRAMQ